MIALSKDTPSRKDSNMKNAKKLTVGLASVVLAGSLAFGATASAAGSDNGDGNGRHRPVAERVCNNLDRINERIAKTTERIATRTAKLQEKLAAAKAAGDSEAVARIEAALTRLGERSTRINDRVAKLPAWTAEHCPAA